MTDATSDQPTTESSGSVIGPYKLVEQIGEGGMGSVWMSQQTEPVKRLVAVKLIKAGMDSRQVIARFEAERQALALMDHSNIARVLDGGTTGAGRPYFVMDLVKGVPITRYCDQHHLTPRQRLELFIPVCQAVQHAHQKGIVHRDLKPSNVLVAVYDGMPVPKIIDFGIAKAAGQQLTDKTLVTGFGAIVGTLEYMSPEQAQVNQLDIDTRSDIYSLGVLLYELLAGSPPFSRNELEKAGMLEMLRVIREQEPSKPSTKLSTAEGLPTLAANRGTEPAKLTKLVRGELDWIVMKALEKDRKRRYETASGFAMDVQRYLADEPVQACPPSAGYRLRKFARRNKVGLAVAALVLFFLALLGSGVGWVVRDRSALEAGLREAVKAALDKVTDLRQRARWGEAQAVLEQVRQRLGPSGALDSRRQVEQAEADLALVDRLDAARLKAAELRGNKFDMASAAREYAAAFREAGIGEETDAAAAVADRIRSSAVREQLVAAVDDWAIRVAKEESALRAWLLAVARAADPDPWRNRFRDALESKDRTALERLAGEAKVSDLSPQIINALWVLLPGRDAEAMPLLTAAQRRYPSDFWLNFNLGVALHNVKRWEEAIGYYRAAIALRPATSAGYHNLGLALYEKGRVNEAIAEYRTALELDQTNARAYDNLGNALGRNGHLDEYIAEHRKAIELNPESAAAHNNLGSALRKKGREDEAIVEYRKAIELDPKYPTPHSGLGNALLEGKGRVDEAIAEHRKAVELDPSDGIAHYNLGNSLRVKGLADEAIAEWKKAVELGPGFAGAHHNLAIALIDTGRVDEAMVEYQKAIELDPKLASPHTGLGSALREGKGRVDEAIAEHRKAVQLDPKDGSPHTGLGNALREGKGRVDEAIAEYRKAIELNPKFAIAHNNLGNALRDMGRVDEAIVEFQKAIQVDPKYASPHHNLGLTLQDYKGRVHEAIAEYQKAIELNPKLAYAHYKLGVALRGTRRVDEAIAAFEEVIRLKPDFTDAHFRLASALAGAKQWDRSASVYAAALKRFGTQLRPGPWYEAIRSHEVFTRLTAQQPDDRLARIMRARLHVLERDWKRAAADYARLYESLASVDPAKLLPEGGDDLFGYGCLLLLLGDRPGYEQFCKKWADRVGDSPAWGFNVARAWGVSARPVVPAQQIVERAEKTLQAGRAPWNLHVLSLAHYRNGEFDRAIERALDSNGGNWSGSAKALNWLVLAMAHSRRGHAADARKSLEQALELAGGASPEQPPGVEWPNMAPPDFVQFELLRREAEELINPESKEKPDKK
jgi:tetratricopeptide (TPR) repeat protein/serine/threonine protein kinase